MPVSPINPTAKGVTADELRRARTLIEQGQPPCGSEQRPHLIHPKAKAGTLARCGTCFALVTVPTDMDSRWI